MPNNQAFPDNHFIGGLKQPPFAAPNSTVTVANDSINLPIVGDEIAVKLIDNLLLSHRHAEIKNDLEGVAGSSIRHDYFDYIGSAFNIEENVPMDTTSVKMNSKSYEIKPAGKALSFTKEQMNHDGYLVEQGVGQFAKSFADKLESDLFEVLRKDAPVAEGKLDFTIRGFSKLVVAFGEDIEHTTLLVSPHNFAEILSMEEIRHLLSGEHLKTGVIKFITGLEIQFGQRVKDDEAFLLRGTGSESPLTVQVAQRIDVNSEYSVLDRKYNVAADTAYVVYMKDKSRAFRLNVEPIGVSAHVATKGVTKSEDEPKVEPKAKAKK